MGATEGENYGRVRMKGRDARRDDLISFSYRGQNPYV